MMALDFLGLALGKTLLREMLPKETFSQGKAAASETLVAPISLTCLKSYLLLCVPVLITFFLY